MANSKLQAFWNHPAGPKTIHFWAPTFKWGLTIANILDSATPPEKLSYPQQSVLACSGLIWARYGTVIIPNIVGRVNLNPIVHFWAPTFKWGLTIANILDSATPPEKLSYPQQSVLACSGLIWARYSTVIIPKNWNLVSVNFAMSVTAMYQLSRKIQHDLSIKNQEVPAEEE
ncbi:hypothetical protein C1H46_014259 [Malus baccata]|uniref:Mitochondrial pyruvate carrier n=1 Tax=Malus baccata TaxID=106549 RepID=A0A540MMY2_MALBA|nr:hypothetical protein C1H46_014259 [Malus baccata]